jgi:hypothetical protein
MNELESWIWIILSVGVPFVFILACINTKPHASHIWEMKTRSRSKHTSRRERECFATS